MSITAILLGVIFRYFSQITICEKKMIIAKEYVLEQNHLEVKLNSIFSQLRYEKLKQDSKEEPFFYTKNNKLYFHFYSGIDPNPDFSGEVKGAIYVNKDNNLILKTLPLDKKCKFFREEVIQKNIKNLEFSFIKKCPQKKVEETKFYETLSVWKENEIPIILKISFEEENGEKLSFNYFLPSSSPSITYYEAKKK